MADLVRLDTLHGRGPLWGVATEDLNATLLAWPAAHEIAEHVNDARDVLLVVLEGGGMLWIDGGAYELREHDALVIPKRARRRIVAGADGIRYLTAHVRREGLQIRPAPPGEGAF